MVWQWRLVGLTATAVRFHERGDRNSLACSMVRVGYLVVRPWVLLQFTCMCLLYAVVLSAKFASTYGVDIVAAVHAFFGLSLSPGWPQRAWPKVDIGRRRLYSSLRLPSHRLARNQQGPNSTAQCKNCLVSTKIRIPTR